MLFRAELEIEGTIIKVLNCEYSFNQKVDTYGRPTPKVNNGPLKLTLAGSENETVLIWATQRKMIEEGTISIYKKGEQARFREIKFENAFCVYYKESAFLLTQNNYTHIISISAAKLTVAGIKYDNRWPE